MKFIQLGNSIKSLQLGNSIQLQQHSAQAGLDWLRQASAVHEHTGAASRDCTMEFELEAMSCGLSAHLFLLPHQGHLSICREQGASSLKHQCLLWFEEV